MTQPMVKDGFFCQEMLARRNEFTDSMDLIEATFARGIEKGYDIDWYLKNPTLDWMHSEVTELAEAIQSPKYANHLKHELGDVLWWIMLVAQKHQISFKAIVDSIAQRWLIRNSLYEQKLKDHGYTRQTVSEELCHQLWAESKKELKAQEEAL